MLDMIAQTSVVVRIEKQRCLTKKEFDRLKLNKVGAFRRTKSMGVTAADGG
jgi:hypothetical protein